ncbi:MAG: NAD-dependent deacylase [Actinomycetia bacterium]|nr:NAD-dependent deacylase [Actinomycetes bacterium]
MTQVPAEILALARAARRVSVLTGAGMSAESGIPTFRDAQTGLWTNLRPEDLATPQAWQRDPQRVWAWYAWRTRMAAECEPHAGHRAIAEWGARPGVSMQVVTQNVDDLHERGGSADVAHLHGSLFAHRCDTCASPYDGQVELPSEPVDSLAPPDCGQCGLGQIRPGIVWFGEALDETVFDAAVDAVRTSDLVLVVGTSGIVYPAAGLPGVARREGVPVVEINPHGSDLSEEVDHCWAETAAIALPALVAALEAPQG